jgi:hypothetical protein
VKFVALWIKKGNLAFDCNKTAGNYMLIEDASALKQSRNVTHIQNMRFGRLRGLSAPAHGIKM